MIQTHRAVPVLVAAVLLAAAPVSVRAQSAALEDYTRARAAYEREASAYWDAVAEKRRLRVAKRRERRPMLLQDYVLTQPPVYSGPARPPGPVPKAVERPRPAIPDLDDFLRAGAEEFGFVPERPAREADFKRAYARAAAAAGLTREQIVGVYIFETGGNGAHDTQAGVLRPGAKPISPALGYNQLLNTNTIGLLAEYGDEYVRALTRRADALGGIPRAAMLGKIKALDGMIRFSRSVPFAWSEHDKLAKNTQGGLGVHAVLLDIDIGPLLQVQKLANSVRFARARGVDRTLTAAELELMNFTGDGNGIDLVAMPQAMRERVPTANFFQRQGYERNPIARRTGVVAALFASIEGKMQQGVRREGARALAAAFAAAASAR